MRPNESFYVLYHKNCADGFGAAFVSWLFYEDKAEYIPVAHGEPMPEIPSESNGNPVYVVMLDFSYSRKQLIELSERVTELVVLDHHVTAQEELDGLDFAIFDMDKSGVHIAWNYFFPHKESLPELLAYIEDRDLWRWNLPQSREVSAALQSYPMDFQQWYDFTFRKGLLDNLKNEGEAILRFMDAQVDMMCRQAWMSVMAGYHIPVVNATAFWSEVASELLDLYPDAPFAAAYFERADGMRQWSLRSRGDFDVSNIAKLYGGGGHPSAAGFQEEIELTEQEEEDRAAQTSPEREIREAILKVLDENRGESRTANHLLTEMKRKGFDDPDEIYNAVWAMVQEKRLTFGDGSLQRV